MTSTNIILSDIDKTIQSFIYKEINSNGLLNDVKKVITGYKTDDYIPTPFIWLLKKPIQQYPDSGTINQRLRLVQQYEFLCVGESDNDLTINENNSYDLAGRLYMSIINNYKRCDKDNILFEQIKLNSILPVGEISITNSSESCCPTSVVIDFVFSIDFRACTNFSDISYTPELVCQHYILNTDNSISINLSLEDNSCYEYGLMDTNNNKVLKVIKEYGEINTYLNNNLQSIKINELEVNTSNNIILTNTDNQLSIKINENTLVTIGEVTDNLTFYISKKRFGKITIN